MRPGGKNAITDVEGVFVMFPLYLLKCALLE
jgi:hypothetical protein